jgi:hypothetical protein
MRGFLPTNQLRCKGEGNGGKERTMDAHVRPREAVQGVEAEAGVLNQDGALDL